MGCCSPNFHRAVKEQEEKVNEQYEEKEIPTWFKWVSIVVSTSLIAAAIYLSIS